MLKDSDGTSACHFAAREGNLHTLSRLIAAGALLEDTCQLGFSTLHYACFKDSVGSISMLIESKVDIT